MDEELAAGVNAVVVDLDSEAGPHRPIVAAGGAGSIPVVIIGVGHRRNGANLCDVIVEPDDAQLASIIEITERHPIASTALAVLLRGSSAQSVDDALASESAVYSMLQSGAEFAGWRRTSDVQPAGPDAEPAVLAERIDDVLAIELNRPHRHNAFSRSMRDALTEMLALALFDRSIAAVRVTGRGPSFCSGGDLGEFGSFGDPASAHRTRLTRSPARLMHRLADRTVVHLHGACMGAGIELPAFASRVTSDVDAVIALPELGLGLIPGAGGTVSIPRRIGRQRTAYLALSGASVSAATALQWGLVDEIV